MGLQNEEQLLVLLKLPAGVFVQGLEIEGVFGRDVFAAEKGSDIASIMFLMLDNLIQSDLVLYKQSNLDVELINILLGELVLSHMLDNRLSQTLEFW